MWSPSYSPQSSIPLTPPLTPSSTTIDTSSDDSDYQNKLNNILFQLPPSPTSPVFTRHNHKSFISSSQQVDLPVNTTRFLLVGNVPKDAPFEHLKQTFSSYGDLKGILVRFQSSHSLIILAFYDLRHASFAYSSISSQPSPFSASGNGKLHCEFVGASKLIKRIGDNTSSFMDHTSGDIVLTLSSSKEGAESTQPAIPNGLRRLLFQYGDLRSFAPSTNNQNSFKVEYFDSRDAHKAHVALHNQDIQSFRISVFLPPLSSSSSSSSSASIPFPTTDSSSPPTSSSSASEEKKPSSPTQWGRRCSTGSATVIPGESVPAQRVIRKHLSHVSLNVKKEEDRENSAEAGASEKRKGGGGVKTAPSTPAKRSLALPLPKEREREERAVIREQSPPLAIAVPVSVPVTSVQDDSDLPNDLQAELSISLHLSSPPPLPLAPPPLQISPSASYAQYAYYAAPPSPPLFYYYHPQGGAYDLSYYGLPLPSPNPTLLYSTAPAPTSAPPPPTFSPQPQPHPHNPNTSATTTFTTYYPPSHTPSPPTISLSPSHPTSSSSPLHRKQRLHHSAQPQQQAPERNRVDIERIEMGLDTRTTIMLKNIPNRMTDKDLIAFIGAVCPRSLDFMYLRIDFTNKCNVGYAFVNFITVDALLKFCKARLGRKWNLFHSEKVLQMSYANYQGKEALVEKFRNSAVMQEQEAWRPRIFCSYGPNRGLPEAFPKPNSSLRQERSAHNKTTLGLYSQSRPVF